MNNLSNESRNYVETLITIFTIDKGELKILLTRKKTEPYKGYWILPGNYISTEETLEDNITDAIVDQTGLMNVYVEQCHTFSNINRNPDDRVIATSFIGLVDSKSVEIMSIDRPDVENGWFNIDSIPKLGYDHELIIEKSIDFFRKKIVNSNILRILFPSDFTLPELQKVYERILGKELDRRNFRKKFINLNLIEDTLEKNTGFNGRPAKLYRFKDEIKEMDLF
ncbi:MAG: NUDIX hydrolase [Bacilli bacterium]|nr:NUDIX hydrolase [Bacilli bacterium]MDD4607723.1 NUDIX hydrolase [Bacilli bacterium]